MKKRSLITSHSFFMFFILWTLSLISVVHADMSPAKIVNLLKKEVQGFDEKEFSNLHDPYVGRPNIFQPQSTKLKSLDKLDGVQVGQLVLNSYNLPPSAMVPKVWLALKMQAFLKEPIRLVTYIIAPKGFDPFGVEKYPLAILSHGSGGHIDTQLWYAYNLAKQGYLVMVPDHFKAVGRECCPTDITTFRIEASALDLVRLADYANTQDYVQKQNIFLLGWSLGGMSVEMAARSSFTNAIAPHINYNACVCFYPQIVVQELAPLHKSKILFILAEHDDYTPARNITNYVERAYMYPGQKDRIKVIVAKDSYHSFDRVSTRPKVDYWARVLYKWASYQGFGKTVVNFIGTKLGDFIFGKYAFHNLQTFKNGQIMIDTQNPLRGFVPLNDIKEHASLNEIESIFKPWDEFQTYFMTHISRGAQLAANPEVAKWALNELLDYLEASKKGIHEVAYSVNTGSVD